MFGFDGRSYQARFDALAAAGHDVHGEAAFVMSFSPVDVLDAGCGTGRVAIELARRGVKVVGADVSQSMIAEARRLAPEPDWPNVDWVEADLAGLGLDREFDVVVMAGNVPIFCPPADRPALVASCAAHVRAGGVLVAGFQLGRGYSLEDYDACCSSSGLELDVRYATWERDPFAAGADYSVSVHRRPSRTPAGPPS